MGIIGEMKRDKSLGSSSASSGGNRSSLSNDRPRPLSAFWGGLGSKSSSSSPKSEPVVPKGYKLKHSYGGSTGHLDAYGAGMGGGMRPAVSMPVVAAVPTHPVASPSSRPISNSGNSKHHRQHRNTVKFCPSWERRFAPVCARPPMADETPHTATWTLYME